MVTQDGEPLLPTVTGELFLLRNGRWTMLGDHTYGFDLPCPALYADGSLAVAGYYGTGFCSVNLDGSMRWRTDLAQADLLPVVNQDQVAAVGSFNDQVSMFFAADGTPLGRYAKAAVFAAHGADWIALTRSSVVRVTTQGEELWSHEINTSPLLAGLQPVVDVDGYIFVRHDAGVLCCAGDGGRVFELALPTGPPSPVSIVAPGTLAIVHEDHLVTAISP
jgi:outer membrane protein assembly factor BamB